MQNGKNDFAVTRNGPRSKMTPFSPTSRWASAVRYGPDMTVRTVTWNPELAQSYMAQPKISRRSFVGIAFSAEQASRA